jgi:enoyl-CoA hydratase/carnithine racemase
MLNEKLPSGLHVRADDNGIGWLILDRPRTANAISPALAADLITFIARLGAEPRVRVVMVQGRGRNFCSGYDLNHVADMTESPAATLTLQRRMAEIVVQFRQVPQPVIAMVQGAATGAGFAIALAADVRLATPDARLNIAMVRIGLTAGDMGISYLLPRLVGTSVAAELMLTGRFIDAARAERVGLVSHIVPHDELESRAVALAEEMMALSPSGLRLTKAALNTGIAAASLREAIETENQGQVVTINQHMVEGVAAFRAKRLPKYSAD